MTKYYRVKKDTFIWEEGAILEYDSSLSFTSHGGYRPIEDIWDTTEHNGGEYISAPIIENNPDWFEKVYKDKVNKVLFITKEEWKNKLKFVK